MKGVRYDQVSWYTFTKLSKIKKKWEWKHQQNKNKMFKEKRENWEYHPYTHGSPRWHPEERISERIHPLTTEVYGKVPHCELLHSTQYTVQQLLLLPSRHAKNSSGTREAYLGIDRSIRLQPHLHILGKKKTHEIPNWGWRWEYG